MTAAIQPYRFYGVYLLLSENEAAQAGKSYIGFTVDPVRRIRQHNGELTCGGARKTKLLRPWRMICIVHGFRSHVQGLQFEWGWQHPLLFRSVRSAVMSANIKGCKLSMKGRQREMRIETNLQVLSAMLSSVPWSNMPLTVTFFDDSYRLKLPVTFPSSICISLLPSVLDLKVADVIEDLNFSACILCNKPFLTRILLCPGCQSCMHPKCAADGFSSRQLIPNSQGTCKICNQVYMWTNFVQNSFLIGPKGQEDNESSASSSSSDDSTGETSPAQKIAPTQISPIKGQRSILDFTRVLKPHNTLPPNSPTLRDRLFSKTNFQNVFQI